MYKKGTNIYFIINFQKELSIIFSIFSFLEICHKTYKGAIKLDEITNQDKYIFSEKLRLNNSFIAKNHKNHNKVIIIAINIENKIEKSKL